MDYDDMSVVNFTKYLLRFSFKEKCDVNFSTNEISLTLRYNQIKNQKYINFGSEKCLIRLT